MDDHLNNISNYTFLPWLRRGIAAHIPNPDTLGTTPADHERASVEVAFDVNGNPINKAVTLLGPGDVIGINPRVIVKTEPRNWVTDFESNYLPYVEFYAEGYPWQFTPAKAVGSTDNTQLRPWIHLLILTEEEFTDLKAGGTLSAIELSDNLPHPVFPKVDECWAWAHVHVQKKIINGDTQKTTTPEELADTQSNLDQLLDINPDNASSRLLSPRKLKPNTAYHAFLIPAFEVGRLAGLGQATENKDSLEASFGKEQKQYPYYYRWYFRTGERGDFEYLVDLLEARKVDPKVGIRDMDVQKPEFELEGMQAPYHIFGLEGALRSPETVSSPAVWPPANLDDNNPLPGSPAKFLQDLEAIINLNANFQAEETEDNPHPDPIISPPLYGQWYAKVDKLVANSDSGWVNQLNQDPRLRVAAGFGTKVIQQNQEKYMQKAWSQLGELVRVNNKIRYLQLGIVATYQMYEKHIKPMSPAQLLAFTKPVHSRVLGSPTTIAQQLKTSLLPKAAVHPAFRKVLRPRGAIMKKITTATPLKTQPVEVIERLNTEGNTGLTAAKAIPTSEKVLSLERSRQKLVPSQLPDWVKQLMAHTYTRWILIVLIAILGAAASLTSATALSVTILTPLVAALVATERLRTRIILQENLNLATFTTERIQGTPVRPNFRLTKIGEALDRNTNGNMDSLEAQNFRAATLDIQNLLQPQLQDSASAPPLAMANAVQKLQTAINPSIAIPRRAAYLLKIPAAVQANYQRSVQTMVGVMAHPVLGDPMYRPLRNLSAELLVPNLNLIPNNTISLLETNPKFIESYMVGVNQEMGRELLWREYPTDQRGSYFRQFWDVSDLATVGQEEPLAEEALLDITPLHTWKKEDDLGVHDNRKPPIDDNTGEPIKRLVLVIRGDLLKKYPTTVIYAQPAKWSQDEHGNDIRVLDTEQAISPSIFKAEIDPDLKFVGFNLVEDQVKGDPDPAANDPGYFFVLQERPGEPRFGLDLSLEENLSPPIVWNDLTWQHIAPAGDLDAIHFIDIATNDFTLPNTIESEEEPGTEVNPDKAVEWGKNAANMAYILYQVPVMVAFHAADMLDS